jgi:hypothetical protein
MYNSRQGCRQSLSSGLHTYVRMYVRILDTIYILYLNSKLSFSSSFVRVQFYYYYYCYWQCITVYDVYLLYVRWLEKSLSEYTRWLRCYWKDGLRCGLCCFCCLFRYKKPTNNQPTDTDRHRLLRVWLVGSLVGWLVLWLVGWLVGSLVDWFVDSLHTHRHTTKVLRAFSENARNLKMAISYCSTEYLLL